MTIRDGALVLADGEIFEGELIGADQEMATGEVVFNTVLSGYQEVITDPSYAGQIITFTYPHIGNYGANAIDFEGKKIHARGVIVRDLSRRHSNWRAQYSLDAMLTQHGLMGIAGIDTRRLTRHLRDAGALPGAFGSAPEAELRHAANNEPGTTGVDLVAQVSTDVAYTSGDPLHPTRIVAYDFGIKTTIVRHLAGIGHVTVVPASTTAAQIVAMAPSGVFLSNGPGDPEMVPYAINAIRDIVDAGVPTFGICLGHQLLSQALGGLTFKLPFGHHGGNHPVRHLATGRIEITSQNHNFCVDPESLAGLVDVTHINLNDNTNEGMRVCGKQAFSVQYHPEAGPGPHDSRYLFDMFTATMNGSVGTGAHHA